MKYIKYIFYVLALLLYIAIFFVSIFYEPLHAAWWLCSTLILFIIIMRKCGKFIKYLSIPIAFICCIIAYYYGSVEGEIFWSVRDGVLIPRLCCDYTLYRYSTYIADCAKYTIKSWIIAIFIAKLYDLMKNLVNDESFRQKVRHWLGRE